MSQAPQVPPPVAIVQMASGRWLSHALGVAAELGLADVVQAGPRTAEEIAAAKGLHAPTVYRLLRALASFGVFREEDGGRFAQTALSDALRSDVPYSMRSMVRMVNRPWSIQAWTDLTYSAQTGESAMEHVHGAKVFDFLSQHPHELEIFAGAMSGFSSHVGAAVADAYDFSAFQTVCDVGGSHGMLLAILLNKYPNLRGVLFDLPDVVAGSGAFLQSRGVADRVQCVGGSFFEKVPAGADAYVLKQILHDWGDGDCVRILRAIHAAAGAGAKLLVLDSIIEPGNEPQFAKLLDIEMLVVTHGGRERALHEWQQLLVAGGFSFSRVVPTASPTSVIEAVRA